MRFRSLSPAWWLRPTAYTLTAALLCSAGFGAQYAQGQASNAVAQAVQDQQAADSYAAATKAYRALNTAIAEAKALGIDTTESETTLANLLSILITGEAGSVQSAAVSATSSLKASTAQAQASQAAAAEEAKRYGTLALSITNGNDASVVLSGAAAEVTAIASPEGSVTQQLPVGAYTATISRAGYTTLAVSDITITSLVTTSLTAKLVAQPAATPKATSTPKATPTPVASSSTAHSSYRRETVASSRGSYTADIMQLELGEGKIKVITDTASDTDCANNCSVIPLKSYVDRYSGVVGAINGTYFCPADYSSCAGQTGSFFWKIKNPRTGTMINSTNGLGEYNSFLTFSSNGTATYYSTWAAAPSVYAGINHAPLLVANGAYAVDENTLDTKQRTTKGVRGALGLRGQTLYAVIAQSATVMDIAAVMVALDVDTAINLDGGGSGAMWYNGSYKRGPGRSLPNALVFVEQ